MKRRGNPGFDLYRPREEHDLLREAIRALAVDKIAPRAAEIDESHEFPHDVLAALTASDFHAIHVPEQYGGAGGDALAACIVIEEVARACASSSLIPAVNKLGSMPLILAGSEEVKQAYLPALARGEGMFSYALSEPEAGSDAGGMRTTAVRDGDDWVLNGAKRWITNAGVSKYYTVMALTDPEKRTRGGITAFVVEDGDEGFSFGAPERKLGIQG
nr:acyl-CoA dehydrogenase family protein [Gemmatimonadales bacterium]